MAIVQNQIYCYFIIYVRCYDIHMYMHTQLHIVCYSMIISETTHGYCFSKVESVIYIWGALIIIAE